jgi:hypothetical protein
MRTLIIILFCCSSVWANDVYVEQAPSKPANTKEQSKPAFMEKKPGSVEKDPIANTPPQEYCSVISGCR